jgi:hypothetical protein
MRLIKILVEKKTFLMTGIRNDSLPCKITIYIPSIFRCRVFGVATRYGLEGSGLKPR